MLNTNLFSQGDVVAVALSGGKDSVYLLHLLISLSKELGITVKALNVEHGIRGESSKRDSEFVFKLCKALKTPLKRIQVNAREFSQREGLTVEEGARKLRYDFFKSAIEGGFCNKVATAHHLSDNVETILLNLFRGASPSGLRGIPEISEDKKIIRPILSTTKEEIDDYVKKNDLKFVEDESNFEDDYSRNFLRLNVIPEIKKRFPEMEKSILRFSSVLKSEDEFLSEEAKKALFLKDGTSVSCNVTNAIFARACVMAMKELGIVKDYDKRHIDALINLKACENGKRISLLNGVVAVKEYDLVSFYKEQENHSIEKDFNVGKFCLNKKVITVSKCSKLPNLKGKAKNELYFDLDKIPCGAKIRNRKEKDIFTKFGGGTKSLGDFMTDKKIPLMQRDTIPLVSNGDEVLIVCGIEISNKVKVDSTTKRIGKITIDGD